MDAKVLGLTHTVGSYLMTITSEEILKPFKYVHLHVLNNCTEVKSYLEYVVISFVNKFVVNYT